MSLLTIVKSASARLSLPVPTTVAANTSDLTVLQMFYLAQGVGKALSRRAAWKALLREKTFTTTAAAAQTSALASDLEWIVPETMFNRTENQRIEGPISADAWQHIQSQSSTTVPTNYRIRGTDLLFTPTPTASQTVAYEYVTNNWCETSGGTDQSAWAADTDVSLLDEEFHILGLMWFYKRAKGLDYSQEFADYENQVRQALLREGTRSRIDTDVVYCEDSIFGSGYTVTPL